MQAFEHIGGIAAVGGAHTGEFAHEGLALHPASGAEVVLHVEAAVVSADFFLPGLAGGSGAAAVGQDHHIALLGHQAVAPAIAPVLAVGALRAAEHDLDGRIDLALVELGRVEHPALHLLMVDGFDPDAFGSGLGELREDVLVLGRDRVEAGLAALDLDGHQFHREVEAVVAGQQFDALFLAEHGEGGEEVIVPVFRRDAANVRVGLQVGDEQGL